ncbi:MAG: putative Ig domain-containing protein, partial [Bryobacteraceae bacterium]
MRTLSSRASGISRLSCAFLLLCSAGANLAVADVAITSPSELPDAPVGQSYSFTLQAIDGTPPYKWSVIEGALPTGLSLNAETGAIQGTPTQVGQREFAIRVADAEDVDEKEFSIEVQGSSAIVITTASPLPQGTVGTMYSHTFAASGGISLLYNWTVETGSLPPGLMLSAAGVLSGTPSAAGDFTFSIRVRDLVNQSEPKQFAVRIMGVVSISTASPLPEGTINTPYSQTLAASGGIPPYNWTITSGSLPAGLSLGAATGQISGTPTAAGPSSFTVQATDSASASATKPFALTISVPALAIATPSPLPAGRVGSGYSQTLAVTGGTAPYAWSVSAGALPPGLNLGPANGMLTGTPSQVGDYNFTVQVTASGSTPATKAFALRVDAPELAITTESPLPEARVGAAYSQTLAAAGGTPPYNWTVTAGALPAGLSLNATSGRLSGTPTAAGNFPFTVRAADSGAGAVTKNFALTVAAEQLRITTASQLPAGVVGVSYSRTLAAAGGVAPYTWAVAAGELPPGLALEPGGRVAGTPTTAGTYGFTARASDSGDQTAERNFSIAVAAGLTIASCPTATGTTGREYSASLQASGGTPPYTWSISTGALPQGLALDGATGGISGTPSRVGNTTFTVRVADSASAAATRACAINVTAGVSVETSTLPNGVAGQAYSQTLAATGGTAPYAWSVAAGALPAGLTLNAGGQLAGTPTTAGDSAFKVRVADSQGSVAERDLTVRILATLNIAACPAANGTLGAGYSSPMTVSGGQQPYKWSVANGQLPPGLALAPATGTLAGTPSAAGNFNFTVAVADNSGATGSKACSIAITAALAIVPTRLADGTVQAAYSQTLQAAGGVAPYTWSLGRASLPPGLTLDGAKGVISGTPAQPGTFTFTVLASDSVSGKAEQEFAITIGAGLVIPDCPAAVGSVGQPYSSTLAAAGGATPYSWSITAGALPAGITLNTSTGAVAGTPSAAGNSTYTARVQDSAGGSATRACSIAIASELQISTASLAEARVGAQYSQALAGTGGTPPYSWSTTAGSIPPGLTLNAGTGEISGTPSQAGNFQFRARLADAAGAAKEKEFTLTVSTGLVITACPTPTATVGQNYNAALSAAGGQPPYEWSLTSGNLQPGLSLNAGTGVISGTPSQTGNTEFALQVKDSAGATGARTCSISVAAPGLTITTGSPLPPAILGTAYSQTLAASGGQAPYKWALADGALPAGITLNEQGAFQGTPTAEGTSTFTVRVTDQANAVSNKAFELRVLPAAPPELSFT